MSPEQRSGLRCILIRLVDRRMQGDYVDYADIDRIERRLKLSQLQSEKKRGENNPRCKLSWEIVASIRDELAERRDWGAQASVAKRYGVSPKAIRDIVAYKTWVPRNEVMA